MTPSTKLTFSEQNNSVKTTPGCVITWEHLLGIVAAIIDATECKPSLTHVDMKEHWSTRGQWLYTYLFFRLSMKFSNVTLSNRTKSRTPTSCCIAILGPVSLAPQTLIFAPKFHKHLAAVFDPFRRFRLQSENMLILHTIVCTFY